MMTSILAFMDFKLQEHKGDNTHKHYYTDIYGEVLRQKVGKTLRHQHNLISIIITYVSEKNTEIDETVM